MTKQVLLVEDDAAIMETLTMFLQYEGYEILRARNVEQANEFIASTKPCLVLLDYMLQGDTAEPVVEVLRSRYGNEVPVLLLTAADDPEGKGDMIDADLVLPKPFELDVLLEKIERCVRRAGSKVPFEGPSAELSPPANVA